LYAVPFIVAKPLPACSIIRENPMSDASPPNREELARQARQHLDSLRAAGVEWLPDASTAPPPEPAPLPSETPAAGTGPLLFPEMEVSAAPALVTIGPAESTVEERQHALTVLAEEVSHCMRCAELASTRTQTVFGVGAMDAELCFVGEAPGADEDAQGEPFVGAAGQLLNRIIAAMGMKREEVYICNILRCRPPGNRLPLPNEASNCRPFLERQLELVRPKFMCALGACAAQNLLGTTLSIGKLRGRFHDYRGIPVMCTYHPAYLLRTPEKKRDVWEDMKRLLERMGRPVPQR
jgi:DNA polymerase